MKLSLQLSLLTLLLLPFSLQCQSDKELRFPETDEIDAIFSDYNNPDTPGASVAVIHKGEILFKKGLWQCQP